MKSPEYPPVPKWAMERIFNFLNQARSTADFKRISRPHPEGEGRDYWIGETVAQRVIDRRLELEGQRYTSLEQLDDVPGVGPDKIEDLLAWGATPAAQAFRDSMFDDLLLDNFKLAYLTIPFKTPDDFEKIANNATAFVNVISGNVDQWSLQRFNDRRAARLAGELVKNTYLEVVEPDYVASYALATWFYRFDADNWFSFERVHKKCAEYFDVSYFSDRRELRFFRGFPNNQTLVEGISPSDLPVVVNFEESVITMWQAELFD